MTARRSALTIAVLPVLLATATVGAAQPGGTALPPSHPPLNAPPPSHPIPLTPKGSGADTHGIMWTPPGGWAVDKPASTMRRAQYRLPGPGGEGECVVFYFGPGQGGDARSNADRWASQFKQPDGRPPSAVVTTRKFSVGGLSVLWVETSGTYVSGMPGGPPGTDRPGYMLLGAIVEGPDANWFFKATGPRETLAAQRGAFEGMIRSIRRGAGTTGR